MNNGISYSQDLENLKATIISLEKAALEKWNTGDPSGYLDLSSHDVTYFDPFTEVRMDGHDRLKEYYAKIKGQIHVSKYEMINPVVQAGLDMAVLTFNLISYEGQDVYKWNCTEVYALQPDTRWKIIQTHWSFIRPLQK